MTAPTQRPRPLEALPGLWALYRLPPQSPWPVEALRATWAFLARTPEEVSLLLPIHIPFPHPADQAGPWRALRVVGPLEMTLIGVLAGLTQVLAQAQVPVLAVSTYETDYLFIPAAQWEQALDALRAAGHAVRT